MMILGLCSRLDSRLLLEIMFPTISNVYVLVNVPAQLYLENVFQTFSTSSIPGVVTPASLQVYCGGGTLIFHSPRYEHLSPTGSRASS